MKKADFGGSGLRHVSTRDLERLLVKLHRRELDCPITHRSLLAAALPDLVDDLDHLQGLDARAVQAILVAVIAERRAQPAS